MFDIGPPEFLVLAIAALLIFGPDKLPTMAKQAGKWVRDAKGMATNVRREFSEQTGIAEEHLDPRNLDPKRFLREQVLGGTDLTAADFQDLDPRTALQDFDATPHAKADRTPDARLDAPPDLRKNPPVMRASGEPELPPGSPYDSDAT